MSEKLMPNIFHSILVYIFQSVDKTDGSVEKYKQLLKMYKFSIKI